MDEIICSSKRTYWPTYTLATATDEYIDVKADIYKTVTQSQKATASLSFV